MKQTKKDRKFLSLQTATDTLKEIKFLCFYKRPPFQNKCFIYILYMVPSTKSFVRLESKRILWMIDRIRTIFNSVYGTE